jgi:ADP-ribose pyrophosphatase
MVERRPLDACVIAAHYVESGRVWVYLRSAIRPPAELRREEPSGVGAQWELPAGLIEPGESPARAAARELDEELGFRLPDEAFAPLGSWMLPCPAVIGEVHWFFHAEVDPKTRKTPEGDGTPLEEGAEIIAVPLDDALAACRNGEVRDAKTELALRRLADIVADPPKASGAPLLGIAGIADG